MLLCVILFWPSKIEYSLIIMQNVLKFENLRKIDWIFFFGRSRFNTSVFEKHFISYSCIFFIKYYALRSFCIKLLCFLKNWFFQNFNRSNLFLDRSKLRLKIWFGSVYFDQCSIVVGSIEDIFDRLNLNFDQSKIT